MTHRNDQAFGTRAITVLLIALAVAALFLWSALARAEEFYGDTPVVPASGVPLGRSVIAAPVRLGAGVVARQRAGEVIVTCESEELERLRTALRLKTAELAVAHGQLSVARKRAR